MDKLSIGRFAQLCRLSVKALRHYDKLGLLTPARVDPTSGYRYYQRSQLRRALAISMLRSLEVPLPAIHEILDGGGDRSVQALAAEAERQSRELARKQIILASLERLVRDRSLSPHPVEIVERAPMRLAVTRRTVPLEAQEQTTTDMIRGLMASLEAEGIGWQDPVICRFPEGASDALALEVGVGVPEPTSSPHHQLETVPGGRDAVARHIGPYATLGLAHHALHGWAREHDHPEAGPLYEVYIDDPSETPPDALVTEVHLPLR